MKKKEVLKCDHTEWQMSKKVMKYTDLEPDEG